MFSMSLLRMANSESPRTPPPSRDKRRRSVPGILYGRTVSVAICLRQSSIDAINCRFMFEPYLTRAEYVAKYVGIRLT